jgi:hypothetical protein
MVGKYRPEPGAKPALSRACSTAGRSGVVEVWTYFDDSIKPCALACPIPLAGRDGTHRPFLTWKRQRCVPSTTFQSLTALCACRGAISAGPSGSR